MGEKLDFTDLYKFLTSVGLALVLAAFIVPWAFLRESFDLGITNQSLKLMPGANADILWRKFDLIRTLYFWLPWLSLLLLVMGVGTLGVGLFAWWRRQRWRDRAEEANTLKAEQGLSPTPVGVIRQRAEIDLMEEVALRDPTSENGAEYTTTPLVQDYINVEQRALNKLTECFHTHLKTYSNQSLGALHFDLVIERSGLAKSDRVVELKVMTQAASELWWAENISRVAILAQSYEALTSREVVACLLVLIQGPNDLAYEMNATGRRVRGSVMPSVLVSAVSQSEFFSNDCYDTHRLLNL